jgi:hypothetical protein
VNGAAVQRVREALQEHGCGPRGSNLKLRARCPVHGSRGGTLAVSQGRAKAVIYCHAQCETDDILAALSLSWPDLYDEPQERASRAWVPSARAPAPAEQAGAVIVRAVRIMLAREAITRQAGMWPARSEEERIEHAVEMEQDEARDHYWRTTARWAALAYDRTYMAEAYRAREAWLERGGERPSHEQFMALMFRAEDLARERAQ